MRICICAPYEPSASETFIRAHIRLLPAKTVLYGGWPIVEHQGRRIIPTAFRVAVGWGSRVHDSIRRLGNRAATRSLAAFLKTHADIVLGEYGSSAAVVAESAELAQIPVVAHFHGYDAYHQEILKDSADSYRRMFASAGAIIAVSGAMEQQLLSLGAPLDRLYCNPYGVEVDKFVPVDAASNPPLFVSVARFTDKKAPYITLLAFQRVIEACPDARLAIVGGGPLLDACRQMTRALGLTDSVVFHGWQDHSKVPSLVRSARAFVQHSVVTTYGDSEGTPNAILEAGASGLPVISTRHAGIPEVVIEGETGLLVDELDLAGMADHMIALAKDPKKAGELGRGAREHVAERYSMTKSIAALRRIMEETRNRYNASIASR